jgi:adenylate cyclase
VGPRTAELVRDQFLVRELDWIKVKGGRGPIAIFEPIARRADATAEQIENAERFAEALAHYRAMRFVDAGAAWDTLARRTRGDGSADHGDDPSDGPSSCMAHRARAFAEHAPPLPWDGARVLTDGE